MLALSSCQFNSFASLTLTACTILEDLFCGTQIWCPFLLTISHLSVPTHSETSNVLAIAVLYFPNIPFLTRCTFKNNLLIIGGHMQPKYLSMFVNIL